MSRLLFIHFLIWCSLTLLAGCSILDLSLKQVVTGGSTQATPMLEVTNSAEEFQVEVIPSSDDLPPLVTKSAFTAIDNHADMLSPTATIPAPVLDVKLPPNVEAIVLLGTDVETPRIGRTDTIILAFIDLKNGNASLVSIPRDLFVYQPGFGMNRINQAYLLGGSDLLVETLDYNLGVRPDHWALAHLDAFSGIVDDLGGIDVQVKAPVLKDCGDITTGAYHMNGEIALCYVRSRFTTSDFDRSRRQLEVLQIIFKRFFSLDVIPQLPYWYTKYSGSIKSDLSLIQLISYLPFALKLNESGQIYHHQIDIQEVKPWLDPVTGAAVLLPENHKMIAIIQEAIYILDQIHSDPDTLLEIKDE